MNKESSHQSEEDLFIESRPVNWSEISSEGKKDLDYVSDILTDTEISIISVLVSQGPQSVRSIWNQVCENKYLKLDEVTDSTNSFDSMRDKLKEEGVSFPSYHTIKKSLGTMKENGVITTRPSNRGNTDELYTINPKFKKVWRMRKTQIRKNQEWKDLHPRTLKFYNLDDIDIIKEKTRDAWDY